VNYRSLAFLFFYLFFHYSYISSMNTVFSHFLYISASLQFSSLVNSTPWSGTRPPRASLL
jgi:hypothetical protein